MDSKECLKQVHRLFGEDASIETVNGVRRIIRPAKEGDEKLQKTAKGAVLLGAGPSWLAALRYAAKPVLVSRQADEEKTRQESAQAARETQVRMNKFVDFLEEKFGAEFEAWLNPKQEATP